MIVLALVALFALTQPTFAATPTALPLAECLRIKRVDAWHAQDERVLLVRSGNRHFRIEMRHDCPKLGKGGTLALRGAHTTRAFICGTPGEILSNRVGTCRVGTVTQLARDEFERQVDDLKYASKSGGDKRLFHAGVREGTD